MTNRTIVSLVIASMCFLAGCGDKDDTATDTSAVSEAADSGASDTAGEAL